MAGSLSRRQRGKLRAEHVSASLAAELGRAVPAGGPVSRPALRRGLTLWRRLGRAAGLSTQERLALRERVVMAFEQAFRSFTPRDFGVRTRKELAEIVVTMLERTGYGRLPRSKLRQLRGNFAGELLELLVQHLENLQKDLRRMAEAQRQLLNSAKTTLVDAHGTVVSLSGEFGAVRKATDIVVVDPSGTRKFIDFAYVSVFEHVSGTGPLTLSFLVETEIKMPTAAGKAGRQIGRAQVRFDLPPTGKIRMVLEGDADPVEISADRIVFAPTSINRTLVTISQTEQYRPSFTAQGGYQEYFWRIGVDIHTGEIWRLVDLLIH
jgi:hypothetical protein